MTGPLSVRNTRPYRIMYSLSTTTNERNTTYKRRRVATVAIGCRTTHERQSIARRRLLLTPAGGFHVANVKGRARVSCKQYSADNAYK